MLTFLFLSTFAILVLGGIPLWRAAYFRWQQRGSLLELRDRISSPIGLTDVMIMFVTWVFGQISSAGLAVFILDIQPDSISQLSGLQMAIMAIIVATGQLVFTAVGMLIIWFRYHRWEIFGIQPTMVRWDTQIGLLSFIMVIPTILLLQWALTLLVKYEHGTLEMLAKDSSLLTIASTWFAAVLVAPVCEEIFFRGILQSWLQRLGHGGNATLDKTVTGGWQVPPSREIQPGENSHAEFNLAEADEVAEPNPYRTPLTVDSRNEIAEVPRVQFDSSATWMPMIVSAAVFGLAHVGQGAAPIPLFVFGLALGYLYRQTGSILPCIVLHMGLNGFSMFWFTMQILFPETDVLPTALN